jgi:hypothetical protein
VGRSSTSSTALRALALLAIAVAVVVFVLRERERSGTSTLPPVQPPDSAQSDGARVAESDPTHQQPVKPPPPDERVPQTNDEPPSEPWARFFVAGTVLAPREALDHAVVIVRPGPNTAANRGPSAALAAWGKPDELGRFRIELSHAFQREMERLPSVVSVQATTDGADPTEVEVAVPFERADFERERELVVTAELRVVARCVVRGSAMLPGEPMSRVVLAAFRVRDGRPEAEPRAVGDASAIGGEFELDVECDGELLLIAFTEGWRPATLEIGARRGSNETLELEPGASLSGRLLGYDEEKARGVAATASLVEASNRYGLPQVSGDLFAWRAGRFERALVTSRVQSDGSFELTGLAPGAVYELRWGGIHGESGERRSRIVTAPCAGLELSDDVAQLVIEVREHGAPLPHAQLTITEILESGSRRSFPVTTGADGSVTVWIAPFARIEVRGPSVETTAVGAAGSLTKLSLGS